MPIQGSVCTGKALRDDQKFDRAGAEIGEERQGLGAEAGGGPSGWTASLKGTRTSRGLHVDNGQTSFSQRDRE